MLEFFFIKFKMVQGIFVNFPLMFELYLLFSRNVFHFIVFFVNQKPIKILYFLFGRIPGPFPLPGHFPAQLLPAQPNPLASSPSLSLSLTHGAHASTAIPLSSSFFLFFPVCRIEPAPPFLPLAQASQSRISLPFLSQKCAHLFPSFPSTPFRPLASANPARFCRSAQKPPHFSPTLSTGSPRSLLLWPYKGKHYAPVSFLFSFPQVSPSLSLFTRRILSSKFSSRSSPRRRFRLQQGFPGDTVSTSGTASPCSTWCPLHLCRSFSSLAPSPTL